MLSKGKKQKVRLAVTTSSSRIFGVATGVCEKTVFIKQAKSKKIAGLIIDLRYKTESSTI